MPRVTGVRRDRRLNGKGSKGQGPNGQCKASINPAAAASLSAANWQRECEKISALRTIGGSGGPLRLSTGGQGSAERSLGENLVARKKSAARHTAPAERVPGLTSPRADRIVTG
jgi:hypothetical protein